MTPRKRHPAHGWLYEDDTDPELLAWWLSIPSGDKAQIVIDALAMYHCSVVANPKTTKPEPDLQLQKLSEDTEWIKQALSDLPGYLDQLLSRVSIATPPPTPQPETPKASEEELARRRANRMKSANRWGGKENDDAAR